MIDIRCDNCKSNLTDGEDCYCSKCYEDSIKEIDKHLERIEELESEIEKLQEEDKK